MSEDKNIKDLKYNIFSSFLLYVLRRYRKELLRKIFYGIIITLVLAYITYPQIQLYSYYLGKILVLQNSGYDISISVASGPNIAWGSSKGKDIPNICSKISIEKVLNVDYKGYIKSLNVDKTLMYLKSISGSTGIPFLAIDMKDDEIDKERNVLSDVINVPGYYIFIYGSFLVVGLIFYKELNSTFNERKKSLAILGSLGVTFRSLVGVIIIEALAYMLVLVTLSVFLTLSIFVLIHGYQPSWVVISWPLMMMYLVGVVFSLIAAMPIIIKAKRLSVMHLLSEV
ncbi:MAG: FtsX-like permease family protein [Thermoprotei archaeon]